MKPMVKIATPNWPRERIAPQSQWKTLPDEQAWWWYWTGSDYAVPHICSVMVSKTGAKDRYFVADGNLAPWCDEMKGFWLKIDYRAGTIDRYDYPSAPNVPVREWESPTDCNCKTEEEWKRKHEV
jgi:hypothetical protein